MRRNSCPLRQRADTNAMTGDREPGATDPDGERATHKLRAVELVVGDEPPPAVRLVREFKGLTVADLLRDELAARLPGQVRSALRHVERGDFEAAERALPGEFAPVLRGPGHFRRERRLWFAIVGLAVVQNPRTLAVPRALFAS